MLRLVFCLADETENLSLGCSFSDSSEGLLRRGSGEALI